MKTVGEAFEIGLRVGLDQAELSPTTLSQRRARAPLSCRSAAARPDPACSSSCCAMPISTTSTPGASCGLRAQRRQHRAAAADLRRRAFGRLRSASVSGATSVSPGRRDEGLQIGACRSPARCRLRPAASPARCRAAGTSVRRSGSGLRAPATPASRRGADRRTAACGKCRAVAARPASRCGRRRRSRRRGRSWCAPARSAPARRSTARSPRSARSAGSRAASDAAANG